SVYAFAGHIGRGAWPRACAQALPDARCLGASASRSASASRKRFSSAAVRNLTRLLSPPLTRFTVESGCVSSLFHSTALDSTERMRSRSRLTVAGATPAFRRAVLNLSSCHAVIAAIGLL